MYNYIKTTIIFCIFFLIGCRSSTNPTTLHQERTLRLALPTSPDSLDPATAYNADTMGLLLQIFEPLLEHGPNGKIRPLLAEKWEIKNNGKAYVFTIKQNVKFHNSRSLTARDFKWSIQRNCDPKLGYSYSDTIFNDIAGYDEFVSGTARSIKGIKVPNPHTLVFELKGPRPYFLGKMCCLATAPIALESLSVGKSIPNISQMIGTGPFRPISYHPDQLFTLRAFQDYHRGAPKVSKIEYFIVRQPHTRLLLYKSSKLDIVKLDSPQIHERLSASPEQEDLHIYNSPGACYVALNSTQKPFNDPRVRKAIAYALNRPWLVKHLLKNIYSQADSILLPSMPGYRSNLELFNHNPVSAKQLLAHSSYSQNNSLEIDLEYRSERPDFQIIAEWFALELKKHLNIKVHLNPIERSIFNQKYIQKRLSCFILRYSAEYLDPQNQLSFMLASFGTWNGIGYKNPVFDQLCLQADQEINPDKRTALYQKAENLALQDTCLIPLYYEKSAYLIKSKVKGFDVTPTGHLRLSNVTID